MSAALALASLLPEFRDEIADAHAPCPVLSVALATLREALAASASLVVRRETAVVDVRVSRRITDVSDLVGVAVALPYGRPDGDLSRLLPVLAAEIFDVFGTPVRGDLRDGRLTLSASRERCPVPPATPAERVALGRSSSVIAHLRRLVALREGASAS